MQHDGPSASLTAPNGSSQRRLLGAVRDGDVRQLALEAHGTGTALGDPIEVFFMVNQTRGIKYFFQVGAAIGALCIDRLVQCASLKSNMGHLEPSAAAAGLATLVLVPLSM